MTIAEVKLARNYTRLNYTDNPLTQLIILMFPRQIIYCQYRP